MLSTGGKRIQRKARVARPLDWPCEVVSPPGDRKRGLQLCEGGGGMSIGQVYTEPSPKAKMPPRNLRRSRNLVSEAEPQLF